MVKETIVKEKESKNMTTTERYVSAKEIFAAIGVDTDTALETLKGCLSPCTAGRAMM